MTPKTSTLDVIAMIHVPALPGTPRHALPLPKIIDRCLEEAELYHRAGITSLAIENMHDIPYTNGRVGPEVTAAMTAVAMELRKVYPRKQLGIQILAAANIEALAVAHIAGFDFIRAEGFVFGHVADEGWINACAPELVRYRRQIGAEQVRIFTDIKKKHSAHAVTADVSIQDTAHAAEFFLADGVIVTGAHTGAETSPAETARVRAHVKIPVWVGSGVTAENVHLYTDCADGVVVGSTFKEGGLWSNPVDASRVADFMKAVARQHTGAHRG